MDMVCSVWISRINYLFSKCTYITDNYCLYSFHSVSYTRFVIELHNLYYWSWCSLYGVILSLRIWCFPAVCTSRFCKPKKWGWRIKSTLHVNKNGFFHENVLQLYLMIIHTLGHNTRLVRYRKKKTVLKENQVEKNLWQISLPQER